jgi:hypothetical protein
VEAMMNNATSTQKRRVAAYSPENENKSVAIDDIPNLKKKSVFLFPAPAINPTFI